MAVAILIGLFLPHPLGMILVGAIAFGGLLGLGDRVARLEGRMEPVDEYVGNDGYQAEQQRIRRRMARYAAGQKEPQRPKEEQTK